MFTLTLLPQPSMLRGRIVRPCPSTLPAHDPTDIATVAVDFTQIIAAAPVRLTYAAQGVVVQSATLSGSMAVYALTGGTDGECATLTTTLTLADGERVSRSVLIPIVSQGAPLLAAPCGALALDGCAITVGGVAVRLRPPAGQLAVSGSPVAANGQLLTIGG